MAQNDMERYAIIHDKNPREIVLLRGSGCKWRRCRFCDYHLDFNPDERENFQLNQKELAKVTGVYKTLEVINSGSFSDLDEETMRHIETIVKEKGIKQLHFECHYRDREAIPSLRETFEKMGVEVKIKIGVETFDYYFRESYLDKGIDEQDPAIISQLFDECCLLQGIAGQTKESMCKDIETGLQYFERVCVNIMVKNSRSILPDPNVRKIFVEEVYPQYIHNDRVDILLDNTDFGVGGKNDAQ